LHHIIIKVGINKEPNNNMQGQPLEEEFWKRLTAQADQLQQETI
jgi:hypothetical protein